MQYICQKCVREKHLKKLIELEGKTAKCSNCGEEFKCIDIMNPSFFQLVKALVRFHYSEWEYNHHLGGDGYDSLFYSNANIFFAADRSVSEDAYEEIVANIVGGPFYEDYDKGVSVFAGYGQNGFPLLPLEAIKTDLDQELLDIAESLKSKNHFLLEGKVTNILSRYTDIASLTLNQGFVLFRARVGYENKMRTFHGGFNVEYHYIPYMDSDIGAPPPHLAASGRVNRTGVSFLYCATDEYTAVAEVRPHPADHVTIGKFQLCNNILVFDLLDSKFLSFYRCDKDIDNYKAFNTLGALLNRTIPPSEKEQYSITQLLADCIRQLGFQGILFNSTVGDGKNIVLFNEHEAKQIENAYQVVEVEKVSYSYRRKKMVDNDKPENYRI
jgi:RES domain-containing protein